MDRSEGIGLGVAVVAHAALFAALYFVQNKPEDPPRREAVAVTLTDEVGLTATAADQPAPAAASGSSSPAPLPRPTPLPRIVPTPQPLATPALPRSRPTPAPAAPRERTRPRAQPRPSPPPPPPASSSSRSGQSSGAVDRRNRRRPDRQGSGSRLSGITDGITNNGSGTSASNAPVSGADRSNLISRITRHVRGCYNIGAMAGTAAEDIVVTLRIRPARSGSVSSGQVSFVRDRGVSGSNSQYRRQMQEAARTAVLSCQMPDLPDSMYENGWSDITLNFIPAELI